MKGSYLKGNIICALPQLKDIFFSRSIIYITHHNKDGAVGIVLNYKIMNIKGAELFKKLHIQDVKSQLEKEFLFTLVVHLIKITVLYFTQTIIKVNLHLKLQIKSSLLVQQIS